MAIEITYISQIYNGINVKSTCIDVDYIGWKYVFPTDNDHVIVYNKFLDEVSCGRHVSEIPDMKMFQITYTTTNPLFHICKWDTFFRSTLARGYMIDILVIDEKENFKTIIKILHEFIKDQVKIQHKGTFDKTLLEEFNIGEYDEYKIENIIDSTKIIEFNTRDKKICNYVIHEKPVDYNYYNIIRTATIIMKSRNAKKIHPPDFLNAFEILYPTEVIMLKKMRELTSETENFMATMTFLQHNCDVILTPEAVITFSVIYHPDTL